MDALKRQRGFSILEILIAMAIAVISITGVIVAVGVFSSGTTANLSGSQSSILAGETSSDALLFGQRLLERERALGREDFRLVNPFSTTSTSGPLVYSAEVNVALQPEYLTKLVEISVHWLGEYGAHKNVKLTGLVGNLDNVSAPDTCNSILSGDWSNPRTINVASIDIDPSVSTDITAAQGKAYITGSYIGNSLDFFVVDVADAAAPYIMSSLNTGPGLNAVALAGNYAYVANRSTAGQLQVIRIADPHHPVLATSTRVVGALGVGNSISYYNGMVYLGLTANGGGPQFVAFDVSSSTNPIRRGSLTIGHDVNAIRVKGKYAYIATPDPEELKIYDVDDPSNMIRASGSGTLSDSTSNGKSVDVVGRTVFLGRTIGLSSSAKQLYLFDATNAALDPLPLLGSADVDDSINDLIVRSNFAFLSTNSELAIYSLSDTNSIAKVGSLTLSAASSALACEGNLMYVGLANPHDTLKIIGPS